MCPSTKRSPTCSCPCDSAGAALKAEAPHPYPLPAGAGRGQTAGGDSGRDTAHRRDCSQPVGTSGRDTGLIEREIVPTAGGTRDASDTCFKIEERLRFALAPRKRGEGGVRGQGPQLRRGAGSGAGWPTGWLLQVMRLPGFTGAELFLHPDIQILMQTTMGPGAMANMMSQMGSSMTSSMMGTMTRLADSSKKFACVMVGAIAGGAAKGASDHRARRLAARREPVVVQRGRGLGCCGRAAVGIAANAAVNNVMSKK